MEPKQKRNDRQEQSPPRPVNGLNRKLFEEAREIKAQARDPNDLEEAEQRFKERRKGKCGDGELAEFWAGYSKVKYAKGDSEIDRAFIRAKSKPYPVRGFTDGGPICVLAALCRELQQLNDSNHLTRGKPFPLSCREVERLFESTVSHTTANSWLHALELKGTIRRVSNGRYVAPSVKGEAATFVFLPATEPAGNQSQPVERDAQDEQETQWTAAEYGTSKDVPF
ncbi:MAG: hypothetical protein U0796_10185 [Gemmatales bacterium]